MAIEKVTAAQFEDQIRAAALDRDSSLDVTTGPIRDTVSAPVSRVLEDQNDRIRRLSLIMSLLNVGDFTEAEMDDFAFNEEVRRRQGTRARGTVFFQTRIAPTFDVIVPINFPVATDVDQTLGRGLSFRTTETKTLPAATAALFFNASSGFYELEVAVEAVVPGTDGEVGQGRIKNFQAPIQGFDQVTNRASMSRGRDRETNEEMAERLLVAIAGTDISSKFGIERYIRDAYPDVEDILTVFGLDPLLTRATSNAGAVDAYVIGATLVTVTETYTFLGVGQPIVLVHQPATSVASVTAGGPAFVQGVDYILQKDTGIKAGSVRGQDAVVFIAGGSAPAIGATVTVIYNYNGLMQTLQDSIVIPDHLVFGRDLLFKAADQIDIEVEADVSYLAGTNAAVTTAQVVSSIVTFINLLGLGDAVEESDVNAEVRKIPGVDNIVFTVFRVIGSGAGVADIPVAKNEYARISSANVTINVVA